MSQLLWVPKNCISVFFDLDRDALVICRVRLFDRDVIVVLIVLIALDALFSFRLSAKAILYLFLTEFFEWTSHSEGFTPCPGPEMS